MKWIMLFVLLVFTGCGNIVGDKVTVDECLKHNHKYMTKNILGRNISCADVNISTKIVHTYDRNNQSKSIGTIEEYVNIHPLQ